MSLQTLISSFAQRTGIKNPASVISSTDPQVLQAKALLEEEINDLASRHAWEQLTQEATFTTIAAESQGDIDTLAPNGFRFILNNTIWDRTDRLPCAIMSPEQWQTIKGFSNIGIRWKFRFRGNKLLLAPTPPAGHLWAFEYQSKNGIIDNDTGALKEFFTKDTDTTSLPESLHLLGLRWRWLREKGLDYAELFNTYEMQVKDAMGRDGGAPNLSFNQGYRIRTAQPAQGSWFT